MGEPVMSAVVQVTLQSIFSLIGAEINLQNDVGDKLDMMQRLELRLESMVHQAETNQNGDQDATKLVEDLRVILYEVKDVLDSNATEKNRLANITLKEVRDFLSPFSIRRGAHRHSMVTDIRRVDDMLKSSLIRNPSTLRPETLAGVNAIRRVYRVHGRSREIEYIVKWLDCTKRHAAKLSVLPIFGMAGVGKSSLAQEIFVDERVKLLFDVCCWVSICQSSDIEKMTWSVVGSIDNGPLPPLESWDLNSLQSSLNKKLNGKKFLLVLDNMWNEEVSDWDNLKKCCDDGAWGSCILVTTRSEIVAKIVGPIEQYHLKLLPNPDCWSIISESAFEDDNDTICTEELRQIGLQIANECGGLPLAAKVLGDRLRLDKSTNHWESVLNRQRTGTDDEIMKNLRMSYVMLPQDIRMIFRFFSIFPSGYVFQKDALIHLWMAQDFNKNQQSTRIEAVMEDCIKYLLDRLMLQQTSTDPSKYVMHVQMHKLARHVSKNECCTIEYDETRFSKDVRHATVVCNSSSQNSSSSGSCSQTSLLESVYKYKKLHTLLLLGFSSKFNLGRLDRLYKCFQYMRALDLSNSGLAEVEDSVSDMKHLRYLNLSNTAIQSLPNSLKKLYNLQTLLLRNCYELKDLPKCMESLSNLRHLDISQDCDFRNFSDQYPKVILLKSMPDGLENHRQIQTLSRFVVSKKKSFGGIIALENLNELRGDLCILNLHEITTTEEAAGGNLRNKKYINRLKMQWTDCKKFNKDKHAANPEAILENLQPHQELRELWIEGYNGTVLSSWIQGLSKLVRLNLSNCKRCKLPPCLGKLPFLEYLCIRKMHGIEDDYFFCGDTETRFPSLKRLEFVNITGWKEWNGKTSCQIPHLRELIIKDCPILWHLNHDLPPSTLLTIQGCPQLNVIRSRDPVCHLHFKAYDELMCNLYLWGSLPSLKCLIISEIRKTEQLQSFDRIIPLQHLERLEMKECIELQFLPEELCNLSDLQDLTLRDCTLLKSLPESLSKLQSLQMLTLSNCPNLSYLPKNGLPPGLHMLSITGCSSLKQACNKYGGTEWSKIERIHLVYMDEILYARWGNVI